MPRACWPASLAESACSRYRERTCLKGREQLKRHLKLTSGTFLAFPVGMGGNLLHRRAPTLHAPVLHPASLLVVIYSDLHVIRGGQAHTLQRH